MRMLFLVLLIFPLYAKAQTKPKIDSVYYLLDTTKIPLNENMWEFDVEVPFKYFKIKCPCLPYDNEPILYHKIEDKGKILSRQELKLIKLEKMPDLIIKAKKFVSNNYNGYAFFLIEHHKNGYVMHRVGISHIQKHEIVN